MAFQLSDLYIKYVALICWFDYAKGDVTRDDSQWQFLAQHSVATLLRHCFEWLQHCSNIATQVRIQERWNGWIFTPPFSFLIPQILMHRPQTPQPGFGSITLLQKFTPHFKILDPRLQHFVVLKIVAANHPV